MKNPMAPAYDTAESARLGAIYYKPELSPYYQRLTGEGKIWDLTVFQSPESADRDGVSREFYKTGFTGAAENPYNGKNRVSRFEEADYACGWKQVILPASWQTQGFDFPIYSNYDIPWKSYGNRTGEDRNLVPEAPLVFNPVGFYRHTFDMDSAWIDNGMNVYISFKGVESAYYVYINGHQAGYGENSYDEHSFDVTSLLNADGKDNLLAVRVHRWHGGSWIENQDFLRLGGIFRDVILYAKPAVHIRDYKVETPLENGYSDANLNLRINISNKSGKPAEYFAAHVSVFDAEGQDLTEPLRACIVPIGSGAEGVAELNRFVKSPRLWSDEDPYLYTLVISLYDEETGKHIESISRQLGFREITFTKTAVDAEYNKVPQKYEQIRINGKPLVFRGVNRHDSNPETGKFVPQELYEKDLRMMKQNNINAIRTAHYPNDDYFYYLTDKYGIYVIAETNMESHSLLHESDLMASHFEAAYHDRLISNIEARKNHASVVMWSLGNESGNTPETKMFQRSIQHIVRPLDSTRPVHYEGLGGSGGVDVHSNMYPDTGTVSARGNDSDRMPYVICEYVHAMGQSVGNLKEYWDIIRAHDNILGAFIWDWADQSLATPIESLPGAWDYFAENGRTDMAGRYFAYGGDWGEHIHSGNFSGNGLVFADRTPQPDLQEVKHIYQSIWFNACDGMPADGKIEIYNENVFIGTDKHNFLWELTEDGKTIDSGSFNVNIGARERKTVDVPFNMPDTLKPGGEYFLNLFAVWKEDRESVPAGHTAAHGQLALPSAAGQAARAVSPGISTLTVNQTSGRIEITGDNLRVLFDTATGLLTEYTYRGVTLLTRGPKLNTWRAPVDNDVNVNSMWRSPGEDLQSITAAVIEDGLAAVVETGFILTGCAGSAQTTVYTIYASGEINVRSSLAPSEGAGGELLKYGAELLMPPGFEEITWYGAGPGETYSDRKQSGIIGIYESTVSVSFTPFLRPQTSGNRTGVRFIALKDPAKKTGLMAAGREPLEASALRYAVKDYNGIRHPFQMPETNYTVLNIDCCSRGLGGNSCGPDSLMRYRLLGDREYSYEYTLVPFNVSDSGLVELSKPWR
jgi:beta-galactosidase